MNITKIFDNSKAKYIFCAFFKKAFIFLKYKPLNKKGGMNNYDYG